MGWFTQDAPKPSSATTEQPTSLGGTYTPMNREERQKCWEARDGYFRCLDRNNILDAVKDADAAAEKCGGESKVFEKDCASSWVIYFKQKRVADFNRSQQLKKLEAEGAVPMDKANEKSNWKLW